MYRTCRTGRSLKVVIFTVEPSVKKRRQGRHPNGAAPAVMNTDRTAGSNAQQRLPPTGGTKMMSTDALNLLSPR
jgi:hypothetical protein